MVDLSRARVALLGGAGMLGRALEAELAPVVGTLSVLTRADVDLTDPRGLYRVFGDGPDFVVNCAAYTAVDHAEAEEPLATRVNGEAPGHLARLAAARGARVVHFSTDYVFDGRAREPYPVDAEIAPINAYGRSKAAGEAGISSSLPRGHLIIRTSWVYAPWGTNFVRTLAGLARERDTLRVVDDQRGRPSSARELARTTVALMRGDAQGTFHATDEGECTWYELAREVVAATGARCRVEPCSSAEFPRPAPRPSYSVLDTSRTRALIGEARPWQEAVRSALEEHG